ncbi:hypothetical protein [Solimonas fluminis]|uniref:hypothetical protein n=1 Tax=Solimonas fluminis TaxID=2086571 RepID=UPI001056E464|nr:hypothetical protein [Solimonas fluminis]
MKKLAPLQFVKYMLGMFNLTFFEERLLVHLKEKMDPGSLDIFEDQLSKATRVDRIINEEDDRIRQGRTLFYQPAKQIKPPRAFPGRAAKEELLAKALVVESDAEIEVHFVLSEGVFVGMEYFSPQRRFYPRGPYEIKTVELFPSGRN